MAHPPAPAPKPGRVKVYRALYDYSARSDQEMSFSEGDLLYVSDKGPNDDWLPASCGGRKGLVPANYVASENVEELPNPLHEAAKRGNFPFLKECIQEQVSVNSLDKSGSTALYWACHGGHTEIVKYLLELPNISVSSQNKLGDTPLHATSWRGHKDCVQMLLDKGANVWLRNQQRATPLDIAKVRQFWIEGWMKLVFERLGNPNSTQLN
ncbi:hypothetical protein WR25_20591 isoform B [Diploscapter pachys]|uniref:Osteoclast-stimulating factor 1 n=1 Tax=Diploscapter pachys TaxID=2018661 RepID=A0A2A2K5D5_9BILA|nr:hypothetical protein WR25_20591 isoform B [Diploscapter pachys]